MCQGCCNGSFSVTDVTDVTYAAYIASGCFPSAQHLFHTHNMIHRIWYIVYQYMVHGSWTIPTLYYDTLYLPNSNWCKRQRDAILLYTIYRILHTTYCILHTAYRIPHTAYRIPHTAHCTLHTAYRILHTVYRIPHTLHTVWCLLHAAWYHYYSWSFLLQWLAVYLIYRISHIAYRISHIAYRIYVSSSTYNIHDTWHMTCAHCPSTCAHWIRPDNGTCREKPQSSTPNVISK
jgi:hypothetical protein